MGPDQPLCDDGREALALRAVWIALVLVAVSLWAIVASPGASRFRPVFDAPSYDQAAKLAPVGDPRGPDAKLEKAKPGQVSLPADHLGAALAGAQSVAAPIFFSRASWVSVVAERSRTQAHHYSATGPPGHQPS